MAETTPHTGIASYGITVKVDTVSLPVTSIPDLGGSPELLETTTLADSAQTYITGIQTFDSMDFECNYDDTIYTSLKTIADARAQKTVTVTIPKFNGTGNTTITYPAYIGVKISGAGVNEVLKMVVTTAAAAEITAS